MSFRLVRPEDYKPRKLGALRMFTEDNDSYPIAKIRTKTGKIKAFIQSRATKPDGAEWIPGVEADDGDTIEKMPNLIPDSRDCLYVVGQSGTYKTTFAREYADNFIEEFERLGESPRVIIVCVDNPDMDTAFNGLKYVWIKPVELVADFAGRPEEMTPEVINPDYRPTLFIFDDLEGISDRVTEKTINAFVHMVLTRGRKYRLYSVFISHAGTKQGGGASVHLLESSHISIPLKHTIGNNIKYTLEKHFNLPPSVRKILQSDFINFGPRALISSGGSPQTIITAKRVLALDQDKIDMAIEEIKEKQREVKREAKEAIKKATKDKKSKAAAAELDEDDK